MDIQLTADTTMDDQLKEDPTTDCTLSEALANLVGRTMTVVHTMTVHLMTVHMKMDHKTSEEYATK